MKNTLVLVADLAGFKSYRLDHNPMNSGPRLEPLETFENPDAHGKIVEKVSDMAGRYRQAGGARNGSVAGSVGERHNMDLEFRKRLIRQMAGRLNAIGRSADVERCYLAASLEINRPLLDELEPGVRAKIQKNVCADLTKMGRAEILGHFAEVKAG
jgi:hypothetical protein